MKILLVHPEDDPEKGSRAGLQWDRIVDLGLGGVNTYERWNQRFHCPIATLGLWREKFGALPRTRELFGLGSGYLIDQHGLDWWEMISMLMHGEVESLILLQHFVSTLGANDELYASRRSFAVSAGAAGEHLSFANERWKERTRPLCARLQAIVRLSGHRRLLGQVRRRVPVAWSPAHQ